MQRPQDSPGADVEEQSGARRMGDPDAELRGGGRRARKSLTDQVKERTDTDQFKAVTDQLRKVETRVRELV